MHFNGKKTPLSVKDQLACMDAIHASVVTLDTFTHKKKQTTSLIELCELWYRRYNETCVPRKYVISPRCPAVGGYPDIYSANMQYLAYNTVIRGVISILFRGVAEKLYRYHTEASTVGYLI